MGWALLGSNMLAWFRPCPKHWATDGSKKMGHSWSLGEHGRVICGAFVLKETGEKNIQGFGHVDPRFWITLICLLALFCNFLCFSLIFLLIDGFLSGIKLSIIFHWVVLKPIHECRFIHITGRF